MKVGFESILQRLGERDLILPFFETALLADRWPENYQIHVDSGEYYGKNDGMFHPSTHPLLDERQLYYMFHPDTRDQMVGERRSVKGQMTLTMGSAAHAVLQTQMQMAGLVRGPQDIEVEYVNTDHRVRGRIDWIVHHPTGSQIVTEFKTCNSYKFRTLTEPLPQWRAQLNLGLDGVDKDLGVLLVMESAWPWSFREFQVRRDRELLDAIYAKFDRVREAIARNEPPRYCCAEGSDTMKGCPARHVCWLKEQP